MRPKLLACQRGSLKHLLEFSMASYMNKGSGDDYSGTKLIQECYANVVVGRKELGQDNRGE